MNSFTWISWFQKNSFYFTLLFHFAYRDLAWKQKFTEVALKQLAVFQVLLIRTAWPWPNHLTTVVLHFLKYKMKMLDCWLRLLSSLKFYGYTRGIKILKFWNEWEYKRDKIVPVRQNNNKAFLHVPWYPKTDVFTENLYVWTNYLWKWKHGWCCHTVQWRNPHDTLRGWTWCNKEDKIECQWLVIIFSKLFFWWQ